MKKGIDMNRGRVTILVLMIFGVGVGVFSWELNNYASMVRDARINLAIAGYENPSLVPNKNDKNCLDFSGVHHGKYHPAHRMGKICGREIYTR